MRIGNMKANMYCETNQLIYNYWKSVADPGFPRDGGANPPGGANMQFCQISQKLYEIEKILTPLGLSIFVHSYTLSYMI